MKSRGNKMKSKRNKKKSKRNKKKSGEIGGVSFYPPPINITDQIFCMGVMFVVLVVVMVAGVYSVHSKLGVFWVCLS